MNPKADTSKVYVTPCGVSQSPRDVFTEIALPKSGMKQRVSRTHLRTIEDWKREFDSHAEWRGKTIPQMMQDKFSGASAFYSSFYNWTRLEAKGDELLRQRLVEHIFPLRRNIWFNLRSIEDWKRGFDSHPEWKGKTTSEMTNDIESGANAFYQAFSKWTHREAKGNLILRKKLVEQIFPRSLKDWSHLKSIEDWKKELDSHPEWNGKSTNQMIRDQESGATAFYCAFNKWVRQKSKIIRQSLVEQIFPRRQKNWSILKSIEDWKREFDSHPEWKDRSVNQMQSDSNSGASAFYCALSAWTNLEAKGDKILRHKLREQIFPRRTKDWSNFKSIEDFKREFDSHLEWKGRTTHQMMTDQESGASRFYRAFQQAMRREAKDDIGLSSALVSRVIPYTRNLSLKALSSVSRYISHSSDCQTFQDIVSLSPPNPDNQSLVRVIRIENEEFKVYYVMFSNAGKIEGRWMIRSADAPKLVAAFGGSMPDASPRDDASVLSVLED